MLRLGSDMDKQKVAHDIIRMALPLVAFDGWTQSVLNRAAVEAGYKKTDAIRVFPDGVKSATDVFLKQSDAALAEALTHYHLNNLKIRERITLAIRLRIEVHQPHREALRKTIALLGLPTYAWLGLQCLYRTVDEIWRVTGDSSTDFSFYTKRLTLAAVYSSTLLYWLDDESPGHAGTWEFLDRRIADVMAIGKIRQTVRQRIEDLLKNA